MKNNLFAYGKSELTHDAIICWLLSWLGGSNPQLNEMSNRFISMMTSKVTAYRKIEIKQQYNIDNMFLDILVILDDKTLILIEDKVDSSEHNNQLNRYKEALRQSYKDFEQYYVTLR